jgi:branched-chain amino acid transport system substrate-binding protein
MDAQRAPRMRRLMWSVIAAAALACSTAASAQDTFKIGYLVDLNGPTAYLTGPGAAEAAKMAIEDFGGTVLGRKIEMVVADHQNKPDIGAGIAREWFDAQNVHAIFDVSHSALAFAVRDLAVPRKRVAIFTSAMSSDLTSARCSANTINWGWDTYSNTRGLTEAVVKQGGKSWFYLTVDYTFGKLLEAESQAEVKRLGGTVLGSTYAPLGTTDYSSNLLQASARKPEVLAFANSATDLVNSLKQSVEFGVAARRVLFVFQVPDADAVGLKNVQGAQFVDQFYWDLSEETRAFSKRFTQRMGKDTPPTGPQANAYGAVLHYLKAVKAAGTVDSEAVLKTMRSTPIDDFYTKNARIREDGRVMRDMYLLEAKKAEESKSRWDLFKVVQKIPDGTAFRPVDQSECPLLKK